MDREDIENRRAENQFWNGAENYQLRADFEMYRPDGEADLYFNTIIGLVYRLYDYERLRPLFNTFQSQTSGAFYTDLFVDQMLRGTPWVYSLPDLCWMSLFIVLPLLCLPRLKRVSTEEKFWGRL